VKDFLQFCRTIGTNCSIETNVRIYSVGSDRTIGTNCSIGTNIRICLIGSNLTIEIKNYSTGINYFIRTKYVCYMSARSEETHKVIA
jgi:acetyltransferase-like isoleucine patch superfamily enzyme